MKRIAITGGAGNIATQLRGFLRGEAEHIRLIDIRPAADLAPKESFFEGDLADAGAMHAALEGMDSVIHLGGLPREFDIAHMIPTNILGTYNVYEAARANGTNRVIFASSNHATGFYPRSQTITPLEVPRPDTRYGLSKCWGEMVAGFYYDKAGIRTLSIRIGNAGPYQLVKIGLTHPDIAAAVVYGMSKNDAGWWKDELAERLGYKPQDFTRDHLRLEPVEESPIAAIFQGGGFCDPEHDGTIRLRDENGLVISGEATQ